MSDDFDGCECVWSHEFAMQRLINFIRQNQNTCTDTECIDVSGRLQRTGSDNDDGNGFFVGMVFMLLAMFLVVVNPSTWSRLGLRSNTKNTRRDNNQDGAPPPPQPPPPAIN
ncbi:GL20228 [Drosophila persimilis]|uniref:Small integral membrane protein 14 n=2 Tax=pseudoobscura subgroup TaxID=32358 RepID=A0A6I8UWH6_DROPS|nr:small integral membrane protein 14 [Drosophila pseudoobscura]XP_002026334.1 small integral membrane protein 14 [Drosophila persimilis]XP_015040730.1 small integral membrane protein 14 [Drosophila pseudoobscura]XP_026841669.1 small integral membrane protein 14 [Drosophila persimilis]EDW33279.1 GL20228 [Drosophila persimilis]